MGSGTSLQLVLTLTFIQAEHAIPSAPDHKCHNLPLASPHQQFALFDLPTFRGCFIAQALAVDVRISLDEIVRGARYLPVRRLVGQPRGY